MFHPLVSISGYLYGVPGHWVVFYVFNVNQRSKDLMWGIYISSLHRGGLVKGCILEMRDMREKYYGGNTLFIP